MSIRSLGYLRIETTDVSLEWLGIDRPFTAADVRAIDAAVALPEVAR